MVAVRKFDGETRERAVRLYREEVGSGGLSRAAARRKVGELLGVNPATLRNWVEGRGTAVAAVVAAVDLEAEVSRLRRENAQLRKANAILKMAAEFFASAEVDRRLA